MARFTDFAALTDGCIGLRLLEADGFPGYYFAVDLADAAIEVGHVSIRFDDDPSIRLYAGNIAYEIDPPHRGRGLAARACRLLRPIAAHHGVTELWIITSPTNLASRRTAESIGGAYVDTLEMPPETDMYALGIHQARRYRWIL